MIDNVRRPGGLEINGIPSADEIIQLGRSDVIVAQALHAWKYGMVSFDESLRVAVYRLAEQNASLHRIATDLSLRAFPDKIILEHPQQ